MTSVAGNHRMTACEVEPLRVDQAFTQDDRWEWRSFDFQPQLWHDAVRDAVRIATHTLTAETYFLSAQTTSSVKLRDDCLEVKRLIGTGEYGMELRRRERGREFPLSVHAVACLFDAWRQPVPAVHPVFPTPEHLFAHIAQQLPDIRVVTVRKWRRMYGSHGCEIDWTRVLISGQLLDSLSVTGPDARTLRGALRALHLERSAAVRSNAAEFMRIVGALR
jgi:hypothetical protein